MTTNSPDTDIRQYLISNSISATGSSGADWTAYRGIMPDQPDRAISIHAFGGTKNPKFLLDEVNLNVTVRGQASGDYAISYAKLQDIEDLLLGSENFTVAGTKYISILSFSSIKFIGRDEKDRPLWNTDFLVAREPSSTASTLSNRTAL